MLISKTDHLEESQKVFACVQTHVKHPVPFCPALELGLGIEFSPQIL